MPPPGSRWPPVVMINLPNGLWLHAPCFPGTPRVVGSLRTETPRPGRRRAAVRRGRAAGRARPAPADRAHRAARPFRAAHGVFRADSPMFSSLRLDDGPMTVHDVERLRRAPFRLILPSCESGLLASLMLALRRRLQASGR